VTSSEEDQPTVRGATHTGDGKELRKLWDSYRAKGDVDSRNELTEFYYDMVRANTENIAKILIEAIEEGDLGQAGAVAFFEAMNEFDPDVHTSFEEFGSLAIRKAIVDEIRGLVGSEETPDDLN
jgi:DNA-directed RNA polymerase specialized sigma subunit